MLKRQTLRQQTMIDDVQNSTARNMKPVPFKQEQSLFRLQSTIDASPDLQNEYKRQNPLILPATFYSRQKLHDISQERGLGDFLRVELNLSRLNCIHKHLWLAGQQLPARPLTQQLLLGRRIVCTENLDLHLLWVDSCIFVKPCPDFLFCHEFWQRHICHDMALWGTAVGFLLSYTGMIQRKSDLAIAHKEGIVPEDLTWQRWVGLTSAIRFRVDAEGVDGINPRFQYRELRLARINWIYRFCSKTRGPTTLVRGYKTDYTDYHSFLRRNIAPITVTTVYVALVLNALQVGLATNKLSQDGRFQSAAYGFTILAILGPLAVLVVLVIFILGFVFVQNLMYTLKLQKARKEDVEFEWSHVALKGARH